MKNNELNRRQVLALASAALLSTRSVAGGHPRPDDETWLADFQQPPDELPEDAPELDTLLSTDDRRPIGDLAAFSRKRGSLYAWWLEFLGALDQGEVSPTLRVLEEERIGSVIRVRVGYESQPGWPTEAYLLKPVSIPSPRPAVAVFHSTVAHSIRQPAGVEGRPEMAFGLKLAERGYIAFCPRNFLWPDNTTIEAESEARRFQEQFPGFKGMAKMLFDAKLAVDILESLPEVDNSRIGAVGHSLGAKEVLYLAAFDERVRVTVSSEGGIGTRFSNWDARWYLGPTIRDASFTHEHHELLALIAPRPFLLIGGDSADGDRSWPFVEAALPVYRLFGDPPRVGLLNHQQGHSVPPEAERAIYEWLEMYL